MNSSKETTESKFIELLRQLQPKPAYLRLFRAIVLDVWKTQQVEASKITSALRRRIEDLALRKTRVIEAYLYETIEK